MYDPRPSHSATSSDPHIPRPQLIRNHQQNLPNVTFYHPPFILKRVGWRGGGSAENENRKGGGGGGGRRKVEEGGRRRERAREWTGRSHQQGGMEGVCLCIL